MEEKRNRKQPFRLTSTRYCLLSPTRVCSREKYLFRANELGKRGNYKVSNAETQNIGETATTMCNSGKRIFTESRQLNRQVGVIQIRKNKGRPAQPAVSAGAGAGMDSLAGSPTCRQTSGTGTELS